MYSPTVVRELNEFSARNPKLTEMIWDHIDSWCVQSETDKIIPFYTALVDAHNQGMSDAFLFLYPETSYRKIQGMGK